MAWLVLVAAGVLEIGWAIGLKYTDGFTRLWPTVATLAAMAVSMVLLGLAVRTLPVGTAYAVWTGIGTVGTVLLGIVPLRRAGGAAAAAFHRHDRRRHHRPQARDARSEHHARIATRRPGTGPRLASLLLAKRPGQQIGRMPRRSHDAASRPPRAIEMLWELCNHGIARISSYYFRRSARQPGEVTP